MSFARAILLATTIALLVAPPPSYYRADAHERPRQTKPLLFNRPNPLPNTFLRRSDFWIGGQFLNAVINRWNGGMPNFRPLALFAAEGMRLSRSCMTTVSSPDLANTPVDQWSRLGWKDSYWSSREMIAQVYADSLAVGMRINACFYLSDGPANASMQPAPAAWKGLSLDDTAAAVEQYTFDTTSYLRQRGISVDLYDVGNEILLGLAGFQPGDRIPLPANRDVLDLNYLQTSVWPAEATLLKAAIRGIRRVDGGGRIVLHIESDPTPSMSLTYNFFRAMQTAGVPFDVAGLSLPYVDHTDLSTLTAVAYFQRWNDLVNKIAALGVPSYIAETSYPWENDSSFKPAMPDFPYSQQGQAAYINAQLRWASNNRNIIGWAWFYPEWYPGINPTAPPNLVAGGLMADPVTLRPAAHEFRVNLP